VVVGRSPEWDTCSFEIIFDTVPAHRLMLMTTTSRANRMVLLGEVFEAIEVIVRCSCYSSGISIDIVLVLEFVYSKTVPKLCSITLAYSL
jgi:hypothetical protein